MALPFRRQRHAVLAGYMDSKKGNANSKQSSRRRFLKDAALAGLAAGGAAGFARGQSSSPKVNTPPEEAVLRDPWTGEPLRDPGGNLLADWTGTSEWKAYQQQLRARGGPAYGTHDKDYRMYGYRSRFVTAVRTGTNGATGCPAPTTVSEATRSRSLMSPLQDQEGIITPASLHFMDEHGFEFPDIDPRQHRLMIHGMVDRPLMLTMEDLRRLPSVSRVHSIECNSNGDPYLAERTAPHATPQDVYGEYSCSEWTGVLLSTLLDMAGVQKGASWIWAEPSDGLMHTKSVTLEKALDDCIICYGQNGEPLRPENGFPLRLLTPGYEGLTNIKRLRRIQVTNEPGMFWRETGVGYTHLRPDGKARWFDFEQGTKSIILRPSGGQQMPGRGSYEIRGLAWSGGGKVKRVEITTDGGKTWKDAQLPGPVFSKAATRFVFPWNWNGDEVMIASRSTDERGTTQPTLAQLAKVWGIEADYFKHPRGGVWRFTVIQPWKIDREGKVTNSIFSI